MRINVGPPNLTINHGRTFMVSDLSGNINPETQQGIFSDDTRFLSYYACYINGKSWIRVTSATTAYYAARIYLINPEFKTDDGLYTKGTLSLIISRVASEGIREELQLTNYGLKKVHFNLEIALRSDFGDIFEVSAQNIVRRGYIETQWHKEKSELVTTYTNSDFFRCLSYRLASCPVQAHYGNGRIIFEVTLEPGATWDTCCLYTLADNKHVRKPLDLSYQEAIKTRLGQVQQLWRNKVTDVTSANEDINRLYRQSIEDLGALRLYDYQFTEDTWIPAAGVPKFVTLFGRDSLIISLQNMIVHPGFVKGTLQKLAQFQAQEWDDWRDAEPGKILHEIRMGELAYFHKIPHTPYYGAADTAPLFLIALHEAWKWLGDDSLLRDYRDVALSCLQWIEQYGDLNSDRFQEYQKRSKDGLDNQSWKDSGDAIVYPDGSQVNPPKALCELQGYAFDAYMRMAEAFNFLGESNYASELRTKATELQAKFEKQFWCEDLGFYALALDSEKQPVRTVASNPGHCLWSGIVSPERAARVVKRLLQADMWSGWGIRTISTQNPAYNPFSYHLGSVWPHDNGMIAMGFKRYGFAKEVAQIANGIFDAAKYFASYRLPELYAGIEQEPGAFPVPYLEANVPQGWAAASVFQLLQALLGLQADAPNGQLFVDPHLPEWLPNITLRQVEINNALVDLQFWREGDITRWDASVISGEVNVKQQAWQPWRNSTNFS
ncbi:amylo-alpha-1,6-glucosidase [Komarekiella sp. 'clone 1']|uniref:Amylo-alpha-1,6-glucosidase n=1 Tax=Komarekiella delphini-convector SJRDD-AB1 TaxID=2593771 RepID=A0AA40SUQ4_9NOST|nr:amylo-alpha-1,6-glucosidase [Komarekiella delphini-convector]MBD6615611.1 amylo-alpha-1,6-glucosidase [Komarekiella delphini-convector SJRDD-AB1]